MVLSLGKCREEGQKGSWLRFNHSGTFWLNVSSGCGLRILCREIDEGCEGEEVKRIWYPRNGGSVTFNTSVPLRDYGTTDVPIIGSIRQLTLLKVFFLGDAAAAASSNIEKSLVNKYGSLSLAATAICKATSLLPVH
ncbi:hypothetical protein [Candidatus Reidiella endopervernicosa]|uniref:Uncharacterized protein n=1 Tax=Candidatus Reidiella endopervernicosa TaxID=2738883 RepID=A0A6N0HZS7_9GAMM|nr:hypothetical protein [Candidatus Reidiella endopervernicosa]QKQ27819.1 hypothetical protein HUE57_17170 [Candidatus Reidiella endopervernicosa]